MKVTYEIKRNPPWGWMIVAHTVSHAGLHETHNEGTHKTKSAAENAVRGLRYRSQMASSDGVVRPRGM